MLNRFPVMPASRILRRTAGWTLVATSLLCMPLVMSQELLFELPTPQSDPTANPGLPVPPEPIAIPRVDSASPPAGTNDAAPKQDKKVEQDKKDGAGGKKGAKQETNDCCGRPGMIPVCRCVPVTKKKSHTEYDTKCELVCVPGCGLLHGHGKHGRGLAVGCCDDGCPSCADVRVRQRHTLLKKVTEKEYDTYEFKIEWVCARCATGSRCGAAAGSCHGHGGLLGQGGLLGWLFSHE